MLGLVISTKGDLFFVGVLSALGITASQEMRRL
jgi:hypothetical protein